MLHLASQEDAFNRGSVPTAPLLEAIADSVLPLTEDAPPRPEDLVRVMTTLRLSWQPVSSCMNRPLTRVPGSTFLHAKQTRPRLSVQYARRQYRVVILSDINKTTRIYQYATACACNCRRRTAIPWIFSCWKCCSTPAKPGPKPKLALPPRTSPLLKPRQETGGHGWWCAQILITGMLVTHYTKRKSLASGDPWLTLQDMF